MGTQREDIERATAAYLIWLNEPRDGMGTQRAQVYLMIDSQLHVLWPSDSSAGVKSKELLTHQVYSRRQNYPAFHFALGGCGYSKRQQIEEELRRYNPTIKLNVLSGWCPSNSF